MKKKSNWIELSIDELTNIKRSKWNRLFSSDDPMYNLVMSNKADTSQQLIMMIGKYEAQAIAIVLEQMTPIRPLIQDVFKLAIDQIGYTLQYVLINAVDDGRYNSVMCYINASDIADINARPADSIAMALRHNSPIYIEELLFKDYLLK